MTKFERYFWKSIYQEGGILPTTAEEVEHYEKLVPDASITPKEMTLEEALKRGEKFLKNRANT